MPRMALLMTCLAFAAGAARADETAPTSAPAPVVGLTDAAWDSPDVAAPQMQSQPLLRNHNARGTAGGSATTGSSRQAWLRTSLALAGVVGLILLLGWGYRAVMQNGGRLQRLGGRRGALVEVICRTPLAPRQTLCLVRVGPRLVLLGATHDNVRPLDVIDGDLAARLLGEMERNRPDSHSADFARLLDKEAAAYLKQEDELDETVTPDETRLRDVREKLAGTLNRLRNVAQGK